MSEIVPYGQYPSGPDPRHRPGFIPGHGAMAPLQAAVAHWVGQGWQVESLTPVQAVMVAKNRCNHVLHGLLLAANFFIGGTIATCLFITIIVPVIWFAVLITQGVLWAVLGQSRETRKVLSLDPAGRIHVS